MTARLGTNQPEEFDLAHIVDRCTPLVSRVCSSRLRGLPLADIEDAVQETFTRLIEADRARIANVEAWLIGVASNVCAQILRLKYRRSGQAPPNPATLADVDDALDNLEERVWLAKVGSLLPSADVKLLHMLYVQDLPTGEVARYFGISSGTARVRAYRARQHARIVGEQLQ